MPDLNNPLAPFVEVATAAEQWRDALAGFDANILVNQVGEALAPYRGFTTAAKQFSEALAPYREFTTAAKQFSEVLAPYGQVSVSSRSFLDPLGRQTPTDTVGKQTRHALARSSGGSHAVRPPHSSGQATSHLAALGDEAAGEALRLGVYEHAQAVMDDLARYHIPAREAIVTDAADEPRRRNVLVRYVRKDFAGGPASTLGNLLIYYAVIRGFPDAAHDAERALEAIERVLRQWCC